MIETWSPWLSFFAPLIPLCPTSGFGLWSHQDILSHHSPQSNWIGNKLKSLKLWAQVILFSLILLDSLRCFIIITEAETIKSSLYAKEEKERKFQYEKLGLCLLWMDKQKLFGGLMGIVSSKLQRNKMAGGRYQKTRSFSKVQVWVSPLKKGMTSIKVWAFKDFIAEVKQ